MIPLPPAHYGPKTYQIAPEILAQLKRVQPRRLYGAAALAWLCIYALVRAYLWLDSWWLYLPAIFLIAGRAGVFLQLAHEVAHGLGPSWFGNLSSYFLGFDLKGYADGHVRHHACANRACDPVSDREKYRVCDPRKWQLWALFLKDACGWTAISTRLRYGGALEDHDDYEEDGETYRPVRARPATRRDRLRHLVSVAAVQGAILVCVFHGHPLHYLALWLVPLTTAHMVLMRIRGIAEHGLGPQLGLTMSDFETSKAGTYYTRSFGTSMRHWSLPFCWIERALIGSLDVFYHHEHHLFPKVPYYHLATLHAFIAGQEAHHNPHIFMPGYFAALFQARNLRSLSTSS